MSTTTPTKRTSNIYMREEARRKLVAGVDAAADAAKVTLGAGGANAILEADLMPGHMITNDGVSIVQRIKLEDPVENIGANLIKEVASRSDSEGGDGTTTTTVLLQAIIHAGLDEKESPMDIKRSLDECLPIIHKALDEQTREITPDDVAQVAIVSGENEELGAMLQEIYQEIGKDGIVELDNSNLPETFYEITEGVRLMNAGAFGGYAFNEPGKAVLKKPLILVSKEKLNSTDEIEPLLAGLIQNGRNELVIFADDIDMAVASKLAYTHLTGGFKTLLIKAPTLWKDLITEDFARVTGATVVNAANGITFKTLRMDHLGSCEKLVATRDETRVIGIKDISEHIADLEEKKKQSGPASDEAKLRLSWLQTKVATLKIGAHSESELSYKRLKAEDARNAAYQALQGGVVPGGGLALLNASGYLTLDTVGARILREALAAPMRQIKENAGLDDQIGEVGRLPSKIGFNARTLEFVNMEEAGIVDPAKVVKNAIKNAISVAGTVLTASVVVTMPKPEQPNQAPQVPGM